MTSNLFIISVNVLNIGSVAFAERTWLLTEMYNVNKSIVFFISVYVKYSQSSLSVSLSSSSRVSAFCESSEF